MVPYGAGANLLNFFRINTFITSAAVGATNMNGSMIIQSLIPRGTVSAKGCRKGTYIRIKRSRKDEAVARTIQRLEKTPIEKMENDSEREV